MKKILTPLLLAQLMSMDAWVHARETVDPLCCVLYTALDTTNEKNLRFSEQVAAHITGLSKDQCETPLQGLVDQMWTYLDPENSEKLEQLKGKNQLCTQKRAEIIESYDQFTKLDKKPNFSDKDLVKMAGIIKELSPQGDLSVCCKQAQAIDISNAQLARDSGLSETFLETILAKTNRKECSKTETQQPSELLDRLCRNFLYRKLSARKEYQLAREKVNQLMGSKTFQSYVTYTALTGILIYCLWKLHRNGFNLGGPRP